MNENRLLLTLIFWAPICVYKGSYCHENHPGRGTEKVKLRLVSNHVPEHINVRQQFVVYAKLLEAVQRYVHQDNILLLFFIHSDPAFFIGSKLLCFCLSHLLN